jgi:hypothetical protein
MKRMLWISILGMFLCAGGCNTPSKTDPVKPKFQGIYTHEETGWTMQIPAEWKHVSIEERNATKEKGAKALGVTIGEEISIDQIDDMLDLRRDPYNSFLSNVQPFEESFPGEWSLNNLETKRTMYLTYLQNDIICDSTPTTKEEMAGVMMEKYTITLYRKNGKVLMHQLIYSTLVNGMDYMFNINYDYEKWRDELLYALKNAKFKQPS